jgi:hypothetical protein
MSTGTALQIQSSTTDQFRYHSTSDQESSPPISLSRTEKILTLGATISAFLIPIKLSLTYIALIPTLLFWLYAVGPRTILRKITSHEASDFRNATLIPLGFFLITVIVHSGLGVSPLHSIRPFFSLLFFSLALPFFFTQGVGEKAIRALLLGQTIAAFHSCIDAAYPELFTSLRIRNLFIGKVTESGQLSLSCLVACGYIWSSYRSRTLHAPSTPAHWMVGSIALLCATAAWTIFSFRNELSLPFFASLLCGLICLASILTLFPISRIFTGALEKHGLIALMVQLPLLAAALIVNLKRGPLLGVFVGATVFFLLTSRKIARLIVGLGALLLLTITPLRERIAASLDHFFIAGGRSTIWRIGSELAAKFPTGLGFHNSETLRQYAPEIPPELKHFHSNPLNILAENGWLALTIFIWFVASTITLCFKDRTDYFKVGVGCALLSWQVAGLVEYNFGDSEVLLLVWAILGCTFTLTAENALPSTPA